jgi:hypothetical protein
MGASENGATAKLTKKPPRFKDRGASFFDFVKKSALPESPVFMIFPTPPRHPVCFSENDRDMCRFQCL